MLWDPVSCHVKDLWWGGSVRGQTQVSIVSAEEFFFKESDAKFTFDLLVVNSAGHRKGGFRLRYKCTMGTAPGPEADSITVSCRLAPHSLMIQRKNPRVLSSSPWDGLSAYAGPSCFPPPSSKL